MKEHPITPPPELLEEWINRYWDMPDNSISSLATQAARWGADMELDACCEWLQDPDLNVDTYKLRAARRPKPPSLKEQALCHLESFAGSIETLGMDSDLIRRALEALPD